MRYIRTVFVLFSALFSLSAWCRPQDNWPKVINSNNGMIVKIYQPEPESLSDKVLKAKAAISVQTNTKTEPVFGTFWTIANVETNEDNRQVLIQTAKVPNIKLSGQKDNKLAAYLKTLLESQLPKVTGELSLDELLTQLDRQKDEKNLSKDLSTTAPKIIYASRPSILVIIDGTPKLQLNKDWDLEVVVNTPFTIVKNKDGKFYLYGNKRWYSAAAATGPYNPSRNVPENLRKIEQAVNEANSANAGYEEPATTGRDTTVSDIIVSTQRAELIQTNGSANYTPIDSTSLTYISNSGNDIFMDMRTNQYYVLISGRWYTSPSLHSRWKYISSDKLPVDFSKIPEGSPKDNVLASIAGTAAAQEAIMDAQIPQTAKVDRNTATTTVSYNGKPRFQSIQGTNMQYAVNTLSSVIVVNGVYYTVDNGVWFQSQDGPEGPWIVCTDRPDEVDRIPPSCPLYNIKYVYVFDVTPSYVYMGYTPGYLNTFIYGPTVVYGTGFYYDPWFDGFYYARPWTWGFNMCYNPWVGWSMGYGYSSGWFHFGIGFSYPGYWTGGWWGPRIYRPPYASNRYRQYGGYYNKAYRSRNVQINNYTTNIYVNRPGVVTRNNRSFSNNRPNSGRPVNRPNNDRFAPANGGSARPTPVNPAPAPQPSQPQRMPVTNNPRDVFPDRRREIFQRNPNSNNQLPQAPQRPAPNNNNPMPQNPRVQPGPFRAPVEQPGATPAPPPQRQPVGNVNGGRSLPDNNRDRRPH